MNAALFERPFTPYWWWTKAWRLLLADVPGRILEKSGESRMGRILIPNVRARPVVPGDGKVVASMMERISPLHRDLLPRLVPVVDQLVEEEAILGTVVETVATRRNPSKVVGTTIVGFLDDEFVAEYLADPHPFLSSSIMRRVNATSIAPFLTRRQQVDGNTGDGMEKLILEYFTDPMDYSDPMFRVIMNELYTAHFSFERGYNIKAVCVESSHSFEPQILGTGMKPYAYFEVAGTNADVNVPLGPSTKRGFYRATRADLPSLPPSCAAAILMTYMPPSLRLTVTEQRLLRKATDGGTDESIADTLGISRDAVKQTWRGIYDHVTDVMPELFDDGSAEASGRGSEKRRRIIAYVRNNLQELKPHLLRRG